MKKLNEYAIRTQTLITNHPQYTSADFDYLSSKGYTIKEIITIWDKNFDNGDCPCHLNRNELTASQIANY